MTDPDAPDQHEPHTRSPEPAPATHSRPETGAGSEEIAQALTAALSRRAAHVRADPTDEARAAVDRRLGRRARARHMRRGALAAVVVTAFAATTLTVGRWSQSDDQPDVSTQGPVDGTTPRVLHLGDTSDDPAELGMPRLVVDPADGFELTTAPQPVASTRTVPPTAGFTQVQTFRPADAVLPVVFAPWNPGADQDSLPTDGEIVDVNGAEARLEGDELGWRTMSWLMADGTKVYLFAYGMPEGQLIQLARGLRRPDPGAEGYAVDDLPAGLVERRFLAPSPDDVTADYTIAFTGDPQQEVVLHVGSGSRERRAEYLMASLYDAETAETIEIMGQPGVVVDRRSLGGWTVLWSPEPNVGAELRISHGTRDEVQAVIDALRRVDAAEWAASLAGARG